MLLGSWGFKAKGEEEPKWFYFEALEDGSTVSMTEYGSAPEVSISYSTDNGLTWSPFSTDGSTTITINTGEKVYFRGVNSNTSLSKDTSNYRKFNGFGKLSCGGRISSLLTDSDKPDKNLGIDRDYCFYSLFNGMNVLEDARSLILPSGTGAKSVFRSMFYSCAGLKYAPLKLDIYNSDQGCISMFENCSRLIQAPELLADVIGPFCYEWMFRSCTSLVNAPVMHATATYESGCYLMYYGCTSLKVVPDFRFIGSRTRGLCGMFKGCTSLEHAPLIPATHPYIWTGAFSDMFIDCSSLNSVSVSFSSFKTNSGILIAGNWLSGVSQTGTFYCPTALGTNDTILRGASYCPEGWTVVNI